METELRHRHRGTIDKPQNEDKKVEDIKVHDVDLRNTFWLTRIIFLRALAFIYFVAFLISYNQNKELIGDNGLLPAKIYLNRIKTNAKDLNNFQLYIQVPTLLWFWPSWDNLNMVLDGMAVIGMLLSLVMMIKGLST